MADKRPALKPETVHADAVAEREALDRLSKRIDAARDSITDKRQARESKYQGLTLAWRMVMELVIGCAFGASIGYAFDWAAGTLPLFLVVFGGLGFAAGVKTMMASAKQMQRRAEGRLPGAANEGDGLGG